MWSIGELAQRSRVPATTLRYYDRIGLLPSHRRANGYRRYDESALGTLQLIALCQQLGCSLDEIRILVLGGDPERRRALAADRLEHTRVRQRQLEVVAEILGHLAVCEHGPTETAACRHTIAVAMARVAPG